MTSTEHDHLSDHYESDHFESDQSESDHYETDQHESAHCESDLPESDQHESDHAEIIGASVYSLNANANGNGNGNGNGNAASSDVPETDAADVTNVAEPETDDDDPIPVEEWLAEAATMTAEIYHPEIVTDLPSSRRRKARPPMSSKVDDETMEKDTDESNGDGRARHDVVGAFSAVATLGTGPVAEHSEEGPGGDGRVIIGVIHPTGDWRLSQPRPVTPVGPMPWRRLLYLIAVVLTLIGIGGAAGYAVSQYLPEQWTAEAEIVVDAGTAQPDRYLATQQVLVESSVVLEQVAADVGVSRKYLEDELKVFPVEASSALGITFVDPDPDLAQAVVSAVVVTFMDELSAAATDDTTDVYVQRLDALVEQRNLVEQRLAEYEAENAQAEAGELPIPFPGQVRRLALESEQLLAQIVSIEQALLVEEVSDVQDIDATVVTEPRVLPDPTWPKPLALTAVGMLAGGVMAALVLFLLAAYRSPVERVLPEDGII